MYGFIASPDFAKAIKDVLQGQQILFEKVGVFNPEEFQRLCTAAANISIDILIVDMTCCSYDAAFVKGIRKYRVATSKRVVLIAPGRSPGDPTISMLVGDGVYDIIAPAWPENHDEVLDIRPYLQMQLSMSYHMGNAARWRNLQVDEEIEEPRPVEKEPVKASRQMPVLEDEDFDFSLPPERVKERVVIQERFYGTITVAVGGADRRTGCTYTSLVLGKMLASHGKTAVVEMFNPKQIPGVFHLYDMQPAVHFPYGVHHHGVDLFPSRNDRETWLNELYAHYDYLVLDFGQLWVGNQPTIHISEFLRAHIRVITSGSSDWDFDRLTRTLSHLKQKQWLKPAFVCIHFSDDARYREIQGTFDPAELNELKLTFIQTPFVPYAEKLSALQVKKYSPVVKEILPKKRLFR